LVDTIQAKDIEFDNMIKQMEKSANVRLQHLKDFNQECETASMQTKKTENILKEKETARHKMQVAKDQGEKELVMLNEKNLMEQKRNYQLSYRYKFLNQKSQATAKRTTMLNDKLKFMTDNLQRQINEQSTRAREVD
jgi:hypothetical protein